MEKLYYKANLFVYALALLICGVSRFLLMIRFVDYETGFYTQDNGIVLIFTLGFAIAILYWVASNRLKRTVHDYPVDHQSRVTAGIGILVGLSILPYMILDDPYPVIEQGYSESLLTMRDWGSILLGVVAAASFVLFGIAGITRQSTKKAMVPALFASLWQVFMLVTRFNSYTTLTTISDNLLSVLFMVFSSLFLMGHARTLLGFTRKDGRNYTIPFGLCTSLSGLLLVVPNYLCVLINKVSMPAPVLGVWESVYILLMSIYSLLFVVNMTRSIRLV